MRIHDKFIVLTGPFGSGKSTLLEHLKTLGFEGIAEPARQILAEQRSIDGNGLPHKDARLFTDLMLSRMMGEYHRMSHAAAPIFFDRGIPDMLGYAALFELDYTPGENAAREYRYNQLVFFAPAWEQIYRTDEERTISFQSARRFGDDLRRIYEQLNYTLIDLPLLPIQERAEFILNTLGYK